MQSSFTPINSEVLVFIGAGATSKLGMPSTYDQTQIFRNLSDVKDDIKKKELLQKYFSSPDLEKVLAFLNLLDGTEKNNLEVSKLDLDNAIIVYGNQNENLLRIRILELRQENDWNAAKEIIKICPHNKKNDSLI